MLAVPGRRRRARFLGQRSDRQVSAGRFLQHPGGLLGGTGVQLYQQVDDDPVLVVLVKPHVGEELTRPVVAERGVGQRVTGLRA